MTEGTHPPKTAAGHLLHNRNFLLLWGAYAVSALGDHLSEMAILKTQNALGEGVDVTPLLARMTFVFFLPFLLLAPLSGLLADRLPRRGVMIVADLVRLLLMLFFAGLIGWTQAWGVWGPFAPLLLIGMFAAIFSPARSALLPTLIRPDQLVKANGMISGLGIIATMAAALLGGYLATHYEPSVAFRYDALTFLASATLLAFIRPPRQRKDGHPLRSLRQTMGELHAGFRYAASHRRIRELLAIAALVWLCGGLVNSVIPAVVRDVYGGDFQAMSAYRAYLGLGFVVGAIIISVLGDALRSEVAITWGLLGIGAGTAVFASSVFLPLAPETLSWIGAVAVGASGVFAMAVMASFNSLLQRTVADRFRGRVFGVKDLCTVAAILTATGALAIPQWQRVDRWVGYILLGVAATTVAAGLLTLAIRLRRGQYGPAMTFAQNLNHFVTNFWWRSKRVGAATVPRSGPVIIAANHTCSADPMFLCAAAPYRPISFMVAKEYFGWPIVRFFLRLAECIPVSRGGQDTAAFKQALRHLRAGNAMGVFPEGRIVEPGQKAEPKDGVVLLALKTGALVVPANISGTKYNSKVLRGLIARHRARVRFGKPIDVAELVSDPRDRTAVHAASRIIYEAIHDLGKQSVAERI